MTITVKHKVFCEETLYEAERVRYIAGTNNRIAVVVMDPHRDGGTDLGGGMVYVMNDAGRTIARYQLSENVGVSAEELVRIQTQGRSRPPAARERT
jgi:hypothetical protein